jgi:hypothetical protein
VFNGGIVLSLSSLRIKNMIPISKKTKRNAMSPATNDGISNNMHLTPRS